MINIISYIERVFAKEIKGRARPAANNNFIKISIKGPVEVINGDGKCSYNRVYNKANLWVAFNRYDLDDAVQSDKTSEKYSFKKHNRATSGPHTNA